MHSAAYQTPVRLPDGRLAIVTTTPLVLRPDAPYAEVRIHEGAGDEGRVVRELDTVDPAILEREHDRVVAALRAGGLQA